MNLASAMTCVIDSVADGRMCSQAVLCCYEVTMISLSAQGDLFPGPSHWKQKYVWQLHLLDSSLALWNRGLPLHPLSERCLLWEHAPWYLSLNSFHLIYRILQLEYTSKTIYSASIVIPASSPDTECSKSSTAKTVLIIMKITTTAVIPNTPGFLGARQDLNIAIHFSLIEASGGNIAQQVPCSTQLLAGCPAAAKSRDDSVGCSLSS